MQPAKRQPAIHQVGVRRGLSPRHEPYWGPPLGTNQSLGYCKIDAERGSWRARVKEAGRCKYKALGADTPTFGFTEARDAARKWFADRDRGISGDRYTVEKACQLYVEDREREKGKTCAQDAKMRFKRTVDGTPFGDRPLDKIRAPHIKTWFHGLELSKPSANRTLTALKAALNLAVANRLVTASAVQEWRDVKPYKDAGKRRDLYLDLKQRRALLAQALGALKDLLEAAMLTGARAGELTSATLGQFDARTSCMTFKGKTGARTVPLSASAVTLFERLAKSKLPAARLLVRDDGKPWAHSDWDELVRDAATRAELPNGTCLYTLRHSFITQAIQDGLSILDVARLVGTSVMMIEKHYGHLVHTVARERLAKLVMT
jgi:integrase